MSSVQEFPSGEKGASPASDTQTCEPMSLTTPKYSTSPPVGDDKVCDRGSTMEPRVPQTDFGILPYTCVYPDADFKHLVQGAKWCVSGNLDRAKLLDGLRELFTTKENPNWVLPCLAVRTALDLFLRIKCYPPGSEVIMSAINIPDMVRVIKHHQLKVVPVDVNLETMAPKVERLDSLVNEKTVAILVAHIFGKWFDMQPVIDSAKRHKLDVIEDCAEGFCGYQRLGHPETDLSLFSFGAIKFFTAFGGAIAKVREKCLYDKMVALYSTYPMQSHKEYLQKVLKYMFVFVWLNCPRMIKPGMYLSRVLNIDHKKKVVELLRGFPHNLIEKLRHQPSNALLQVMFERLSNFDPREINIGRVKCEYVTERLPEKVRWIGQNAMVKNNWLYPIVVDNPDEVLKVLNALGVDAYRGATQLNLVEPENGNTPMAFLNKFLDNYPHEAKYLFDHVVYLPVNKTVPFHALDQICAAVEIALANSSSSVAEVQVGPQPRLKLQSKL